MTVADLGDYLGGTPPAGPATLAVALASGAITSHCGWSIAAETTTWTVDAQGGPLLALPTLRLTAVTAVTVNGVALNLAATDAPTFTRRGQLHWPLGWPRDARVDVAATHGFSPVPDVVRLVTLSLATRILNNPDDAVAVTVSSVSRRYDKPLSELDSRLLDPFRLYS